MRTKKVNMFSLMLIMAIGLFNTLVFTSCNSGRIGQVIITDTVKSSSLGDVIVVLKQEGKIRSVHTLAGFEQMPLARFTHKRRQFDEIMFLAIPNNGVSVKWMVLIDKKFVDMPLSAGTALSIPVKYVSELVKLNSTLTISSKFFYQRKYY